MQWKVEETHVGVDDESEQNRIEQGRVDGTMSVCVESPQE
jgi:hypothetical protein